MILAAALLASGDSPPLRIKLASIADSPYHPLMLRFFDMTDRARLPQRFCRQDRSVLARLR